MKKKKKHKNFVVNCIRSTYLWVMLSIVFLQKKKIVSKHKSVERCIREKKTINFFGNLRLIIVY